MRNLFSMIFLVAALAVLSGDISAQAIARPINGGVLNGKATSLPKPAYPQSAREAGIGGTVSVTVTIDESGTVISALGDNTVQQQKKKEDGTIETETVDVDMSLRAAAEAAALQARFSPTLLSGKPVQVTGKIVYNFVPDSGAMAMVTAPRAATPVIAGEARTVSGGVLNSRALSLPAVLYPPAARAVKAEGTVQVQVLIDESGNVVSAQAVSGHPLLRSAAVSGAQSAKFSPTQLSGEPVKVSGVITYTFALPKSDDK